MIGAGLWLGPAACLSFYSGGVPGFGLGLSRSFYSGGVPGFPRATQAGLEFFQSAATIKE